MDCLQFIIELLKQVTWPIVTVVSILLLRNKISNLIGGLKSAKHGDTEIQFFESKQDVISSKSSLVDLKKLIPTDVTGGLREDMDKIVNEQLDSIHDDKEKIDILFKNLSQLLVNFQLERIYSNIFGSQISLLEFLNVKKEGKAEATQIASFFEGAKNSWPEAYNGKSFSDYMSFLLIYELVSNSGSIWQISKTGRGFLNYISANNFNKNKAL